MGWLDAFLLRSGAKQRCCLLTPLRDALVTKQSPAAGRPKCSGDQTGKKTRNRMFKRNLSKVERPPTETSKQANKFQNATLQKVNQYKKVKIRGRRKQLHFTDKNLYVKIPPNPPKPK